MISVLIVKSGKIGSKIIRLGLGEPASHLAISFDDKTVIHAHGPEATEDSYEDFIRINTIVARKDFYFSEQEQEIHDTLSAKLVGKPYDYPVVFYWTLRVIMKRLFGTAMPKHNAWDERHWFVCVEALYFMPKCIWLVPEKVDLAMTSPWQVAKLIGAVQS